MIELMYNQTRSLPHFTALTLLQILILTASCLVLVLAGICVGGCTALSHRGSEHSSRRVLFLDGVWQIAEGGLDFAPARFEHTVPVPGLVSLARPAFIEPGPIVKDRQSLAQKDSRRDAFWYRRTFQIGPIRSDVATLKIGKAMFGTRVILNGKPLGNHLPSFTPGYFDARDALREGENELLVRVGSDRNAL